MTTPVLLTSLLPLLGLLPGAFCVASVWRRHRRLGEIANQGRALNALTVHLTVMVSLAVLTCTVALVALVLDAAAWGLGLTAALCMIGCGAGWWIGSTNPDRQAFVQAAAAFNTPENWAYVQARFGGKDEPSRH